MTRGAAHYADWLSLHEASQRLHGHPTTLRQWADDGRIRTFRTAGGHRRFSEADVQAMQTRSTPELGLLLDASVGRARLLASAGRLESEAWYSRFDEVAKEKQRELGQDLMRLAVAHAAEPERKDPAAVRRLGERYASLAREVGLSMGDAMRAFHLFESVVDASVGQLVSSHARGSADLQREVSWFLNEVRIAMVESLGGERK